jgi:hypothetical protein
MNKNQKIVVRVALVVMVSVILLAPSERSLRTDFYYPTAVDLVFFRWLVIIFVAGAALIFFELKKKPDKEK